MSQRAASDHKSPSSIVQPKIIGSLLLLQIERVRKLICGSETHNKRHCPNVCLIASKLGPVVTNWPIAIS